MNIITYITNKSRFIAKDLDEESPSENHVFIEFIVFKNLDSNGIYRISENYQEYSQVLPTDGHVRYVKLEVSTISNGENVYVNGENIWDGNKKVTNIIDLLEYKNVTQKEINFKCDIDNFSIVKLQNCLSDLQRKTIFDGLRNCNIGKCDKNKSDKQNRDFLFISLVVLENLICQKKWIEAESILDGLSSCNSICPSANIKLNCNCNG